MWRLAGCEDVRDGSMKGCEGWYDVWVRGMALLEEMRMLAGCETSRM